MEAMRQETKVDLLQPLAIIASGLVIAAAIYLKPINPPEKLSTVAMGEFRFAIVEDGVARLCVIAPKPEEARTRGFQYGFAPLCGDGYSTSR